jgi:hypothetical protein
MTDVFNICVACGERYAGDNHHCKPKREAQIEAARKASEKPRRYTPQFSQRLKMGFEMMNGEPVIF